MGAGRRYPARVFRFWAVARNAVETGLEILVPYCSCATAWPADGGSGTARSPASAGSAPSVAAAVPAKIGTDHQRVVIEAHLLRGIWLVGLQVFRDLADKIERHGCCLVLWRQAIDQMLRG